MSDQDKKEEVKEELVIGVEEQGVLEETVEESTAGIDNPEFDKDMAEFEERTAEMNEASDELKDELNVFENFINSSMDNLEEITKISNLIGSYHRRKGLSDVWEAVKPVVGADGEPYVEGVSEIDPKNHAAIKAYLDYSINFKEGLFFEEFFDKAMLVPSMATIINTVIGINTDADVSKAAKLMGFDEKGTNSASKILKMESELKNRLLKDHPIGKFGHKKTGKIKSKYYAGGYATAVSPAQMKLILSIITRPNAYFSLFRPLNNEVKDKLIVDDQATELMTAYNFCLGHIADVLSTTFTVMFSSPTYLDRYTSKLITSTQKITDLIGVLKHKAVTVYPEGYSKFGIVTKRNKETGAIEEQGEMDVNKYIDHPLVSMNAVIADLGSLFNKIKDLSYEKSAAFKSQWDLLNDEFKFPESIDDIFIDDTTIERVMYSTRDGLDIAALESDVSISLVFYNLRTIITNIAQHSEDSSKMREGISSVLDQQADETCKAIATSGFKGVDENLDYLEERVNKLSEFITRPADELAKLKGTELVDLALAYAELTPIISGILKDACNRAGISDTEYSYYEKLSDFVNAVADEYAKRVADKESLVAKGEELKAMNKENEAIIDEIIAENKEECGCGEECPGKTDDAACACKGKVIPEGDSNDVVACEASNE